MKTEDLIISICVMARAHEENVMKADRVRSAWSNKRKDAANRILTAKCPGWLRASEDKSKWEVIRERAHIVRAIYRDSATGLGVYAVMTKLNKNRVPVFGRSKGGWHTSTVDEILKNRAVLGEFQPHHLVDGKREPTGAVLKNYYPAMIHEETF